RLTIEARGADGAWSTVRTGALPGAGALLEGIAVERSGAVDVLAGDAHGRWLALADARGVHVLARPAKTAAVGLAGLTLAGRGRRLLGLDRALPVVRRQRRAARPPSRRRAPVGAPPPRVRRRARRRPAGTRARRERLRGSRRLARLRRPRARCERQRPRAGR